MTSTITRCMSVLALAGAFLFSAPAIADDEKATIDKKAPEFTLKDTAGKDRSLEEFKDKIVVLQWVNPDCPICRRVMENGTVTSMIKDCKAMDEDIVFITINSTHYMEKDTKRNKEYLEKNKIEAIALLDDNGKVGKLYGARTTPHMYVIDEKGVLRYQGAITDDGRGKPKAKNHVTETVKQLTNGSTVSPTTTRPFGCGVKYKK